MANGTRSTPKRPKTLFASLGPENVTFKWKRPKLYPKQEAALFDPARIVVVEASTKTGKTVGCIIWLVEQALKGAKGHNYWWVAPTREMAKIAYRRCARIFPPGSVVINRAYLTIELPNGSLISFKGGDNPDGLYGEDVFAVVIDESTRCKEQVWWAVRSTLTATQAPCRIIGNVKGKKNWAYKLARLAEKGEPDMHYAKLIVFDAVAAGLIPESEVAAAERQLPPAVFKELYLAEASDDGGNPFGLNNIEACVELFYRRFGGPNIPDADGVLRMRGMAVGCIGWGWDLAKSMNWTVGVGLDDTASVTRFARWHGVPWARTVDDVIAYVGTTPTLVDSTGVGNPVLENMQRRNSNIEGYVFSETSKQQLMEGLAVAVSRHELAIPEGPMAQELRDFEYEYTRRGVRYSAPEGMDDDCVMALGLAVECRRRARSGISGRGLIITL